MIPLTFCVQSDQVKAKRLCYSRTLLVIDILVYAILLGNLVFTICNPSVSNWYVDLLWNLLATILTFALCISLRRIR